MKSTGRLTRTPQQSGKDAFLATQSGEDIARQSRVETLRRLVAAGRYRVEPENLASAILQRALRTRGRR
jgi:anti-sigma28 factor (negative regulator of flagellin synthesis)